MFINFVRFISLFYSALAVAPDSLQMVNVLYRHGDRSPVATYPNDPYKDLWPQGPGWLTTDGMSQQYELGQFLRSEYSSILSSVYNNTEIVVASSNINRCLMSAYCNLAGLYPPQGDQIWNPILLWQPIPVHTRPEAEDHVLAIEENCPRYTELFDKELHSPAIQQEEKKNAELYTYIEKSTGIVKENISVLWEVADILLCEKDHNYTLPPWTQTLWDSITVYQKLRDLNDLGFSLLFNGTQLSRLKGGPLLKVFIQNMQNATAGNEVYKMYMYSAHDTTVAALADAMKVYNMVAPPYATAVLVELHAINNNFCVMIRYRNDSSQPPYTLVHPDCQQECCPLLQFIEVTKARIPVDWEAECGNVIFISTSDTYLILFAVLVALLAVMLVILIVCIRPCRRKAKGYMPLPS